MCFPDSNLRLYCSQRSLSLERDVSVRMELAAALVSSVESSYIPLDPFVLQNNDFAADEARADAEWPAKPYVPRATPT